MQILIICLLFSFISESRQCYLICYKCRNLITLTVNNLKTQDKYSGIPCLDSNTASSEVSCWNQCQTSVHVTLHNNLEVDEHLSIPIQVEFVRSCSGNSRSKSLSCNWKKNDTTLNTSCSKVCHTSSCNGDDGFQQFTGKNNLNRLLPLCSTCSFKTKLNAIETTNKCSKLDNAVCIGICFNLTYIDLNALIHTQRGCIEDVNAYDMRYTKAMTYSNGLLYYDTCKPTLYTDCNFGINPAYDKSEMTLNHISQFPRQKICLSCESTRDISKPNVPTNCEKGMESGILNIIQCQTLCSAQINVEKNIVSTKRGCLSISDFLSKRQTSQIPKISNGVYNCRDCYTKCVPRFDIACNSHYFYFYFEIKDTNKMITSERNGLKLISVPIFEKSFNKDNFTNYKHTHLNVNKSLSRYSKLIKYQINKKEYAEKFNVRVSHDIRMMKDNNKFPTESFKSHKRNKKIKAEITNSKKQNEDDFNDFYEKVEKFKKELIENIQRTKDIETKNHNILMRKYKTLRDEIDKSNDMVGDDDIKQLARQTSMKETKSRLDTMRTKMKDNTNKVDIEREVDEYRKLLLNQYTMQTALSFETKQEIFDMIDEQIKDYADEQYRLKKIENEMNNKIMLEKMKEYKDLRELLDSNTLSEANQEDYTMQMYDLKVEVKHLREKQKEEDKLLDNKIEDYRVFRWEKLMIPYENKIEENISKVKNDTKALLSKLTDEKKKIETQMKFSKDDKEIKSLTRDLGVVNYRLEITKGNHEAKLRRIEKGYFDKEFDVVENRRELIIFKTMNIENNLEKILNERNYQLEAFLEEIQKEDITENQILNIEDLIMDIDKDIVYIKDRIELNKDIMLNALDDDKKLNYVNIISRKENSIQPSKNEVAHLKSMVKLNAEFAKLDYKMRNLNHGTDKILEIYKLHQESNKNIEKALYDRIIKRRNSAKMNLDEALTMKIADSASDSDASRTSSLTNNRKSADSASGSDTTPASPLTKNRKSSNTESEQMKNADSASDSDSSRTTPLTKNRISSEIEILQSQNQMEKSDNIAIESEKFDKNADSASDLDSARAASLTKDRKSSLLSIKSKIEANVNSRSQSLSSASSQSSSISNRKYSDISIQSQSQLKINRWGRVKNIIYKKVTPKFATWRKTKISALVGSIVALSSTIGALIIANSGQSNLYSSNSINPVAVKPNEIINNTELTTHLILNGTTYSTVDPNEINHKDKFDIDISDREQQNAPKMPNTEIKEGILINKKELRDEEKLSNYIIWIMLIGCPVCIVIAIIIYNKCRGKPKQKVTIISPESDIIIEEITSKYSENKSEKDVSE